MVNGERGTGAGVAAHPHGGGGHRSDEWLLSRARAESDDMSPVTGTRHYVTAGYRAPISPKGKQRIIGAVSCGRRSTHRNAIAVETPPNSNREWI